MIGHDEKLDATHLRCPLPVPRLKKIMNGMKEGEVLHVIASDPCSVSNILAFTGITGYQMQIMKEEVGKFHFYIRKT
jgi:tRNA 2-thiouridine synthesizing protein A